ncbi:ladderlectin-like [Clarias gariepinus]|uniref:ladderlectin-like n=1 Tax=Clarias gariepinus TaxID=13013 RepID=UPI00234DF1CD|nr:ladderlectin-like [Clarias gariepinus]
MAGHAKVVLVLLLAVAATAFGSCSRCPGGWSYFNGRCFKFQAIKRDWASAERFCLNLGAHLISIHHEAEYQHAKSIIRAQGYGDTPTWIGLSSCEKGLNWFWSDGTQVTFTKWNPGEPNSLPRECCVHMNWRHRSGIKNWNDIPCNRAYSFMCARRSQ